MVIGSYTMLHLWVDPDMILRAGTWINNAKFNLFARQRQMDFL